MSLGYSPEGVSTLRAFCVSSLGETGTVPQVTISVDSDPPPFPDVPTPSLTGGRVHLAWDPVTDAGSGLARYTIYRNLVGSQFSAGDAVAFVTDPSFTDDAGSASGVGYYAVSASDGAGNESMLSDAVRTSADATPPSAPGDLQAWLNGDGFARMSWLPSIDPDTGVAYYVVERSVSGLPMSAVATVPARADFWDDFDPEAADAAGVSYQVTAFDRAGNASTPAGPAGRGTDNGAPSTPAGLSLLVLPTPDGSECVSDRWRGPLRHVGGVRRLGDRAWDTDGGATGRGDRRDVPGRAGVRAGGGGAKRPGAAHPHRRAGSAGVAEPAPRTDPAYDGHRRHGRDTCHGQAHPVVAAHLAEDVVAVLRPDATRSEASLATPRRACYRSPRSIKRQAVRSACRGLRDRAR